jgi:4-amino-4-deoxy-L-arabinose transferase-like glycosyltransferase
MKITKNFVLFSLVLILAIFLRVYRLDSLELFGDELDVGYQAYSILKTGKDYQGNTLPVYMESLSESRAPLFLYSAVPFVAIFGLNEWGVRLPAVFWGVLGLVFLYLLVKFWFKDQKIALLSAFLLSISFWHLHYSRAAFEVTLLLSLILAGTYFFLKAKEQSWLYLLSAVCFGLSFYTYNIANVFVPLWGLALLFFRFKTAKKLKPLFVPAGLLVVIVFPLGLKILGGQAAGRFSQINIFANQKSIDWLIEKRSSGGNDLLERVFHNKLTRFSLDFAQNYLTAFSPQFLFISGDPNPRHSIPGFGLLPWALLPLLVFGAALALRKKSQEDLLVFGWLVFAPVASALTVGGGNQATRLFVMLPPLMILCATGARYLLLSRLGKVILGGLATLLVFNLLSYSHELFAHYPKDQFRYWHYGYKETTLALKESGCARVYINNSHDPFLLRYLFWMKIEPAWFQKNFAGDQQAEKIGHYFRGFSLGENYFGRIEAEDKLTAIREILKEEGTCVIAFQKDEIPGDWNLEESPFDGIEVLKLVKNPLSEPYIYLLKGRLL